MEEKDRYKHLEDKAWAKMSIVLDEEIPKRKNRYLLFYVALLVGFLVSLPYFNQYFNHKSDKEPTDVILNESVVSESNIIEKEIIIIPASVNNDKAATILDSQNSKLEKELQLKSQINRLSFKNNTKPYNPINFSKPLEVLQPNKKIAIIDKQESNFFLNKSNLVVTDTENLNSQINEKELSELAYLPIINSILFLSSNEMNISNSISLINRTPWYNNWRPFISINANYNSPYNALGIDMIGGLSYVMSNRWSIDLEMVYHIDKPNFTNESNMLNSSGAKYTDRYYGLDQFITSHKQIESFLKVNYSRGNHWRCSLGIGVTKATLGLGSSGYTYMYSHNYSLDYNELSDYLNEKSNGLKPEVYPSQLEAGLRSYEETNQYIGLGKISLSYQFNKKLSMNSGYVYYFDQFITNLDFRGNKLNFSSFNSSRLILGVEYRL